MSKIQKPKGTLDILPADSGAYIPSYQDKGILGDVDDDGEVTVIDATFIQRKLASIPIPFELDKNIADVDKDGDVTIIDATMIQRWLVDLPANENIGKPIS